MRRKRPENTDTSQLWPLIEEIALDLQGQSSSDPQTRLLCDGLAAIMRKEFLVYSKQLARGDIAHAKRTLEAIGQKLAALALSTTGTSDQTTPDDGVAGSQKLYNDAAETLSVQIDQGLGLYRELEEIHRELGSCLQEVIHSADQWTLGDDVPGIKDHLVWLLDASEGFNAKVSGYFIDPSLEQEVAMRRLLDEAKQRLDTLQAVIDQAEATRQRMREAASPAVDNLPKQAVQLLKELQDVRKAIKMLPADTVNGVVSSSELLTPEELDRWRYYEEHALFGNFDRMRADLVSQAQRIWRRLDDAPSLSDETMTAIADAHRYVERLRKRFEAPAKASVLSATTPSAKRKVQPARQAVRPQPASTSLIENDRLDEIYQLAVAVASYKYCSSRHLVGMTATSVLGILASLGKITEAEKKEYRKPLAEKLESRSLKVDDRRKIHSLWEETSPRGYDWIYFKPKTSGSRWLWRLVQKAQAPGQEIARRLGITQDAVEKASREYREDQLARRQLREKED